jgi:hypothetical protein
MPCLSRARALRIVKRALSLALLTVPLLATRPALAAGKSVDEATAEEKKEAGSLYDTAMADFDRSAFDPALKGFRQSYAVVKSPNSHFMIARTLARLGRNAEAFDELTAVIAEAEALGGRYADTVSAAYAKMEEIRPRVGFVTVSVANAPKGAKVLVNDEPLDPARLGKPVPVLPGPTKVTVVTPTGERFARTATIEAGSSANVDLDVGPNAKKQDEPQTNPRDAYKVELEAHLVGETLVPPSGATRGAGPGALVGWELLRRGVLGDLDSLAVAAGFDWIATSNDPHFSVPIALQWNLWLTKDLSLRVEPGAALLLGAGDPTVSPVLLVGARYRIHRRLYATGRVGIPGATLGVALQL